MLWLLQSTISITKSIQTSISTPTKAPAPDRDKVTSGCVANDYDNATHPDANAVGAGFDTAIQH